MRKLLFLLSLLAVLFGCRTESSEGACTLENFIAVAIDEDAPREISAWDKSSKFEIICCDADKVSYRATEYQYTGGAHGYTLVQVGTVDRKTGRKYRIADIIPESRRGELLRKVREDIATRRYGAKSYAEWRARKEIAFGRLMRKGVRMRQSRKVKGQAIRCKYTTWGKAKLTDKDWSVVGEGEEDNFTFSKVTVEMK